MDQPQQQNPHEFVLEAISDPDSVREIVKDEEVCWESWILKVSLAQPRNENDRAKLRKAMSRTLLNEVINITNFVSLNKGHIPPITSSSNNPFPYQITVNPKEASWSGRLRMY
ncbi:hypothetical protein CFO_g4930 [Ceratocystis platani]|uniref:Autophagy-related protein 101 n=1 Tax=Ceratocystis fimbriata f. sp. platani TaxID=88771 RepID=A0A0F8B060_CERFI|nr:hypothetical protein CFO_g4930 [Ceratocystis platani]